MEGGATGPGAASVDGRALLAGALQARVRWGLKLHTAYCGRQLSSMAADGPWVADDSVHDASRPVPVIICPRRRRRGGRLPPPPPLRPRPQTHCLTRVAESRIHGSCGPAISIAASKNSSFSRKPSLHRRQPTRWEAHSGRMWLHRSSAAARSHNCTRLRPALELVGSV